MDAKAQTTELQACQSRPNLGHRHQNAGWRFDIPAGTKCLASDLKKKKDKKKKKGKVNIPLLFLNAHYLMSTGNADLILLWQKGRAKDSLKCLSRFFPFPLTRTLPLCVCVCVCARTNAHHSLSPLIIITTVGKIITVGHSWTSRLKEHCNCGFVFTKERLMMN